MEKPKHAVGTAIVRGGGRVTASGSKGAVGTATVAGGGGATAAGGKGAVGTARVGGVYGTSSGRPALLSKRSIDEAMAKQRSEGASKAAKARHAAKSGRRPEVLAWYQAHGHEYQSKDDAAYAAAKLYPVEPSTIRRWLRRA